MRLIAKTFYSETYNVTIRVNRTDKGKMDARITIRQKPFKANRIEYGVYWGIKNVVTTFYDDMVKHNVPNSMIRTIIKEVTIAIR